MWYWYGHMAKTHFRTSYNTSTSNILASSLWWKFLDVGIFRNPDGSSLHHNVYRKLTHSHRYLNHHSSFHHPGIKSSVNRTHVQRAYNLCDPDTLPKELRYIKTSLQRNGYKPSKINISKPSKPVSNPDRRVSSTQSLTPSNCLPYLAWVLRHINSSASSNKQASGSTTPPPTNFKDFSTPIRINRIPATEREYTGFLVSVAKSTSGKQDGISQRDWKNTEHTAAEDILISQPLNCEALPHQGQPNRLALRQLNSSHPSNRTHGIPQTSGVTIGGTGTRAPSRGLCPQLPSFRISKQ